MKTVRNINPRRIALDVEVSPDDYASVEYGGEVKVTDDQAKSLLRQESNWEPVSPKPTTKSTDDGGDPQES